MAKTFAEALSGGSSVVVNYTQQAMSILKKMSEESVLTKEQVVKAMNLFINETKGKVFCLMTDEEIRMAYLQMEFQENWIARLRECARLPTSFRHPANVAQKFRCGSLHEPSS